MRAQGELRTVRSAGVSHYFEGVMFSVLLSSILFFQYIQVPVAIMRQEPSLDAEIVSQAIFAEEISVLETREEWVKIETVEDEYVGWTNRENLRERQEEYASCTCVKPLIEVNRLTAHVFSQPDIAIDPLFTLPFECRLEAIDPFNEGPWLKIKLLDETEAYILKEDVTSDIRAISMDQMVELSKNFLDVPFTEGGRSSFGYDSSGFVQMLYRRMGFYLPRNVKDQGAWEGFETVPFDMLSKGDLIFWGSSEKDLCQVSMYIGSDQCLHFSKTEEIPKLKINTIEKVGQAWAYSTARRLKN